MAAARAEADAAAAGYCCSVPAPSASVTTASPASLSIRTGSLQRAASIKSALTRASSSARVLSAAVGTFTLWGTKDATVQAVTLQAAMLLASTAGVTSLQRALLDFSRRYLPGLEEEQQERERKRTQRTRQARRRIDATLRECGAAMRRAEATQAIAIRRLSLRLSLLQNSRHSWRTRTYNEGIWPTSWSELESHA